MTDISPYEGIRELLVHVQVGGSRHVPSLERGAPRRSIREMDTLEKMQHIVTGMADKRPMYKRLAA